MLAMERSKSIVRLRKKLLKSGNYSLYLDIWHNKKRKYEFLKLYINQATTTQGRILNKENLLLGESIRSKRQLDLKKHQYGFRKEFKMDGNFISYFKQLIDEKNSAGTNHGNWSSAYKHLLAYAGELVPFREIDVDFCKGFKKFLINEVRTKSNNPLSKNSQHSYFNKFRACLNRAMQDGIIPYNPVKAVPCIAAETPVREYLTIEEVRALVKSECRYPVLKRTFLFCCLTGLRWSDANKLLWRDVHKESQCYRIKFRQQKTGGLEYLDISEQAVELMGERTIQDERVFKGLKYSAWLNLELQKWVMRAGIDKHITFHCSRHTFAVMQLEMGTEIYTVSKLLGHQNLKTTEVYAKIVDSKKREAMMNIPLINL